MDWVKQLAQYAGPIALAAFAGVFLGGIALSFFWKNFGPWKLLESAKEALDACHAERDKDAEYRRNKEAEMADLKARYDILLKACQAQGLGLQLQPIHRQD